MTTHPAAAEVAAALDVERIRADFPALHQEVHGKPLVYLDNAATTQKPRAVIDAVAHFYERDCSNVHRGVHLLSQRATVPTRRRGPRSRTHLGAADSREIVFTRGTTEGINLVASSFVRPRLEAGDEILISAMEHHSNIVPWQMLCEERGAQLKVIPIDDDGDIILDEYERLLSERTKIVGIVHVSNALGTVNPVREMIATAHARGVPVLVDGAQAVPHMRGRRPGTRLRLLRLLRPQGLRPHRHRRPLRQARAPARDGALPGRRRHDPVGDLRRTTFNEPPHRFEAGTPNIEGAIGLAAALDYVDGRRPRRDRRPRTTAARRRDRPPSSRSRASG